MTGVFADTTFYVALFNRQDSLHAAAAGWAVAHARPVITTEFVLLEVANFFKRPADRVSFAALVNLLDADPATRVIAAGSSLFRSGLELFADRPDKEWSLTDCISFVVMKDEHLRDALTADHHFAQAGFTMLLQG